MRYSGFNINFKNLRQLHEVDYEKVEYKNKKVFNSKPTKRQNKKYSYTELPKVVVLKG